MGGKLKIKILFTLILLCSAFGVSAENTTRIENLNEKFNIGRNQVNCMCQDSIGFIWFGMANGLYKFDNTSMKFIEPDAVQGLDHPDIRAIIEYDPGILLLGTYDYGLLIYNSILEKLDTVSFTPKFKFSNIKVNKLLKDENGIIWVGTKTGLYKIKSLDKALNTFEVLQVYTAENSELFSDEIFDIKQRKDGEIWFLTMSQLGQINSDSSTLRTYRIYEANTSFIFLNENKILISCYGSGLKLFDTENHKLDFGWNFQPDQNIKSRYVYKDLSGRIWQSISNEGLFLLDPELYLSKSELISYSNKPVNSINSNIILQIGESRDGTVFLCTDAGINRINHKDDHFQSLPSKFKPDSDFLFGIRALLKVDNEHMLIGSMGAGLKLLNMNTKKISDVIIEPNNIDLGKNIQSIIKDKQGNYWLGTEGDGIIKMPADKNTLHGNKKYLIYRLYPTSYPNKTLLNDFIMCLYDDDKDNIWIGTWYGLSLLSNNERKKEDQSEAEILNFLNDPQNNTSISSNTILCILQDKSGTIWVGTQNGINKIVKKNDRYSFDSNIKDEYGNSITAKSILSLYQSENGKIWFSTHDGGICLLEPDKMFFHEYNSKTGFIDYIVNSIQEDEQGNLWLGTNDGICRYDPVSFSYNLYKQEDGLLTNLYLFNATSKVNNTLFFGGDKGLVYFSPENLKQAIYDKNLVLTDIKLFNKSIHVNQSNSPLKKSVNYTNSIDLKYNQNFVSFEFSSLNFKKQKDIQYSCILEGIESEWNELGSEHKITYTNLAHGTYTFKVKAYDSGIHKNFEERVFNIKIHPPLWKTKVALILLYVLLFGILYKGYTYFLNLEKRRNALALERLNSKKEHEIDLMKLRFFMNVSHEFRTPLTLLSAPLETLMKGKTNQEKTKSYYQLMHQNIQRLKKLIDEMLELRKIDAGYLKVDWNYGNFVEFTKRIFDTFQNYAEKRNIKFTFKSSINEHNTYFDADKLDTVLFNIISNAFKYTKNGGKIELRLSTQKYIIPIEGADSYNEILIKDTGIGISKKSIENIFQRFQNTENAKPIDSASTGIGLSLAKELIELHKGEIQVESIENQGSTFKVILPIYYNNPNLDQEEINEKLLTAEKFEPHADKVDTEFIKPVKDKGKKPLVLIVEDNEDLRTFLSSVLDDHYEIIGCENGEEGIELAKKKIPDLIISDIMMDKLDGISMCKIIKSDEKTSHIPIILLTARQADSVKLDGFQTGADDYIVKPFNVDILKIRINNLIQLRRKLRAKFSLGVDNVYSEDDRNSIDLKFIAKLNKLINDNIDSYDLNPSFIASEMAMSRMQLYRKVTALTDQTVNTYIRTIRLNKAAQLLLTTDLQIAEIAYKVGYSEPSNFTKSFSTQFNQTPSQFVNSNKK